MFIPVLTDMGMYRAFLFVSSGSVDVTENKEMPYWFGFRLKYIASSILSENDLFIFVHKCNNSMSSAEIAKTIGCSIPTVNSHFKSAIQCLHGQDYLTKGYSFAEIEDNLAKIDVNNCFCPATQTKFLHNKGISTIGDLVTVLDAIGKKDSKIKPLKAYNIAEEGLLKFLDFCKITMPTYVA